MLSGEFLLLEVCAFLINNVSDDFFANARQTTELHYYWED